MDKLHALEVMRQSMNPRVTIPTSMLKEAKDWKVGESYGIMLKVKQVRSEETDGSVDVTFEIEEAKACGMEDEEDDVDEKELLTRIEKNTRGFATA